jgi:AcrR family transcriptional regulator
VAATRRRYDASRRQEQAATTRGELLAAARRLFLARGYAATTMAAIAGEVGVSVETVYKAFGNKAGLVKVLVDVAIAGDDEPVPMLERDFVRRNIEEPDPRVKLTSYAMHLAASQARTVPVLLLLRDAAAGDEAVAEIERQLDGERLIGMTAFAAHLAEGGHLREDVSTEEARDVLATFVAGDLFHSLVDRRGWTVERYGEWLGARMVDALLPAPSGRADRR